MNILITAGGTSEKIDAVRYISNHATGRLGKIIASVFLEQTDTKLTYLCSKQAQYPVDTRARVIFIDSVTDLKAQLEHLLTTEKFDAVIHSMAVSDYAVTQSFPSEDLFQHFAQLGASAHLADKTSAQLLDWFKESYQSFTPNALPKKISSKSADLFLALEQTPKIISAIKSLQPQTILVGFKLLVGTSDEHLVKVANQLLLKNHCDYVVANDLETIHGKEHHAWILDTEGNTQHCWTKEEIAQSIFQKIYSK